MTTQKLNVILVITGVLMVGLPVLLGAMVKEPLQVYREFPTGETKQRLPDLLINESLSPPLGPELHSPTPFNFTKREGLIIKVVIHPELMKYIKSITKATGGIYKYELNIGDFIKIKRLDNKIEVAVEGKTVASSELLNDKASIINLTIRGYPLKVVVAKCVVPDILSIKLSHELKKEALAQFNKSPFVKWLKENKFDYTIYDFRPTVPLNPVEKLSYHLEGTFIDFSVEGLRAHHYIHFKNPYTVHFDVPKEVLVSSEEKGKYYILFKLIGVHERGEYVFCRLFSCPCPGVKSKPSTSKGPSEELNITSELVNRVLETLKSNKLTKELLKICNIKKISGYTYRYEKRIRVILVSEKLKKCEIIIRLNIEEKKNLIEKKIEDVYIYCNTDL